MSHEIFEHIAEAIPQMVWVTDARGRTEYVNRQWTEFTGMDLAATLERGWAAAIHPDDVAAAHESWVKPRAQGEHLECEVRYRNASDGNFRHFLVRAVPLRDARGEITRWLGTSTDIHEQKQLLQRIEAALASRDDFLSIASHELKTPLTSLNLQLQMLSELAREGIEPEQLRARLRICELQGEKLATLLEELLDLTRLRSGQLSLDRRETCLSSVVEDALHRSESELRKFASPVTLELDRTVRGHWDSTRIGQVVSNLLSNALKYGEGRPVQLRLSRVPRPEREAALLEVRDEGLGISHEMQERIFERFERAVCGKRVAGLGLGLYISRQLVEAHGGAIRVRSEPSRGSTFTVELPL